MQKKGRPTLVIVLTIEESIEFSAKLRNAAIDHLVLNDKQSESEDFVVERAGRRSAVTVATNTAGRGTDIKLEKTALLNGGLHVVLAFFPINLRVECQGLGRAGRQGQKGSCQLVIESEKYAVVGRPIATNETLKRMYDERTKNIQDESQIRKQCVQKDDNIFAVLTEFFNYVEKMRKQITSPKVIAKIKEKKPNVDPSFYAKLLHSKLQQKWAEFFTDLESTNTQLDIRNTFKQFIDEFWKEENMADPFGDISNNETTYEITETKAKTETKIKTETETTSETTKENDIRKQKEREPSHNSGNNTEIVIVIIIFVIAIVLAIFRKK